MRLILAATTCVIISVGVAFADCPEPQGAAAEQIPDGTTATRDQMVAAQKAVKAYDTAVRQYTQCLQQAGDSGATQNVAVEKDQELAQRFNSELHAYEAKHKGD
ncbi:MAG TPA: hypothetical protein VHX52_09075 [Steroidobacteraceae bacterium]|jgi:hypothetical protein|nr:hypothetical protein [Steroidobacteraceae bacterium]